MIMIGLFLGAANAAAQPVGGGILTTLRGDKLHLPTVAGNGPTLVTFWALWCTPCKQELRALQKLYDQYSSRGFTVVAVNQDTPKSLAKVR
jgi:cytochrome c biogenesis protein CcmG/thiol:disulfide interchange protein DsbE